MQSSQIPKPSEGLFSLCGAIPHDGASQSSLAPQDTSWNLKHIFRNCTSTTFAVIGLEDLSLLVISNSVQVVGVSGQLFYCPYLRPPILRPSYLPYHTFVVCDSSSANLSGRHTCYVNLMPPYYIMRRYFYFPALILNCKLSTFPRRALSQFKIFWRRCNLKRCPN